MEAVERRKGKRYLANFGVVYNDGSGLNFSFIANFSRSGAYLSSEKLFSLGTSLQLQISNGSLQVPIRGKVVRVDHRLLNAGQSGMGVEFEPLSPTAKRLRDDLLLYLMSLPHHDRWVQSPSRVIPSLAAC